MPPVDDFAGVMRVRAHAKINLALAVGPPAPPRNYHPIRSWFAAVDLCDEIELSRPRGVGADSTYEIVWATDPPPPRLSPIDWPIEKDLGVRAHRLLEKMIGRSLPVHMRVQKRIPVGGGLGGGSSDAAAVLIGLNRFFELGLSGDRLAALGSELGSDVPFFVDSETPPRPALVSGFGEAIQRLLRVHWPVLLILPPFGCPTGSVYACFDGMEVSDSFGERAERVDEVINRAAELERVPTRGLFNDLGDPACEAVPELREVRDTIRGVLQGLRMGDEAVDVHVTGSGSTLFIPSPSDDPEWLKSVRAEILAADPRLAAVGVGIL